MPPVRWKLLTVTIVCLLQLLSTDAQFRQDEMSVDGWRPIHGTRKPNNYYESFPPTPKDFYKYEMYSTINPTQPSTVTPGPSRQPHFRGPPKPLHLTGKKNPHQKHYHPDPFFALPTHNNRGPQIPISSVYHTRPSQIGHIKPLATTNKPYIQVTSQFGHINQHSSTSKPFIGSTTSKRNIKQVHVQTSTSGYRDDIFTASATSGAYNHHKQRPNNIRTRETVDLGLPGHNHYTVNQPYAHIEFNRYPLPSTGENGFQQYNSPSVAPYVFEKHPQANDINYQTHQQHEEFTRNLIASGQIYKNKFSNKGKPELVLQVPPPLQYNQQKSSEPQQVQVQVTKEKLHEFHNNIPPNYYKQYIEYDFSNVRKPTEASKPVYEVTENESWNDRPSQRPLRTRRPNNQRPEYIGVIPSSQPKEQPSYNDDSPTFLPTPYKPEKQAVEPTSPTQEDVSTIFTKLSVRQREKQQLVTPNPFAFNTKEVSTHYPIFGKPVFAEVQSSKELSNELTTQPEEEVLTTREPQRIKPHRRRRPDKRTTTTTTSTTTEPPEVIYDVVKTQEEENSYSAETDRPLRVRKPNRFRTTTPSSNEEFVEKPSRGRNRYRHRNSENVHIELSRKRQRPSRLETTTSVPDNHKSVEEYYREPHESEEAASEKSEEIEHLPKPENHFVGENLRDVPQETIKPFIIITTTEKLPTTNLILPENEVDVTSTPNTEEIPTTIAPTTTNTNFHRIKPRPLKFDNSNRPRFSVKDYRQKLNLHSTTTTPQPHRSTENVRIRLPSRLRRPVVTTPVTLEEETTETVRAKFTPKDARHSTTEATNSAIITEMNVKSINTRLRPFGKYKSTTTTTAKPKVSIKSDLFSRKRPPVLTLRGKIFNKYRKNSTETTTEKVPVNEEKVTEDYDNEDELEVTTEFSGKNIRSTEDYVDIETTTNIADISKSDPYFYSQRVSDLTSSLKNDYNTPGLFKSVSPTSRRIPNYFTIATEDPILPIEAFFSNIKEKNKEQDS